MPDPVAVGAGGSSVPAFFEYCREDRRRWLVTNSSKALKVYAIARDIPESETAAKSRELFAFLETYAGPAKAGKKPGYLVPYFALATFAGIRPGTRDGELAKIHALEDKRRIIDPAPGVHPHYARDREDGRPAANHHSAEPRRVAGPVSLGQVPAHGGEHG